MRSKLILTIFALIVFLTGISTAQVKSLSVREFDDAMTIAFGKVEKKIRRITATVTEYKEGKEDVTSSSEYEYLPPNRFRSRSLNSKSLWEYIQVADDAFIREKEGTWEIFVLGGSEIPPYLFWSVKAEGVGADIYKSQVSEDKLNGQLLKRYSRESRQSFENIKGHPPTHPVSSFDEVWIGTNGLVLKAASTYYQGDKKNILQRWVLKYEYDPKDLKIEAPIK